MKGILKRIFFENWPRKAVSIILAIVIWLTVNHSLTTTKTLSNIPVRIINLADDKTIDGMQKDGLLTKKVTLTLTGKRAFLNELTTNDLEVIIDAAGQPDEWIASISKKNLVSLTPDLDISKGISDVSHQRFIIRLTKLISEKIPILITQPIGGAPRGYKFLDIWPYRLTMTVSGPEEEVKRIKTQGQKLTFNLNNISKADLDAIATKSGEGKADEVSFFVPEQWKLITLPSLSDLPLEIDDPQAKLLRIDFVRSDLIPLDTSIPVSLYFPPESINTYNPQNTQLVSSSLVHDVNGIKLIEKPLFVKGVSHLFVDLVRNMLQLSIVFSPASEMKPLDSTVLFINPRTLENEYVSKLMSDSSDEAIHSLLPALKEEYLRNRFRSYMNHFKLYNADDTPFELDITLDDGKVTVSEKAS